jgi:hypothetical protein
MDKSNSKSLNASQSNQESKQVELELPEMSDDDFSESDQYVLPTPHVKFCFSPIKEDGTFCYCGYWAHTQSYQQRIE